MLNSIEATKIARDVADIVIGKPLEGVVGCQKTNDGFSVRLEVTDTKARLDDSDLVATYELILDKKSGEMLSCNMIARFRRGDAARAA